MLPPSRFSRFLISPVSDSSGIVPFPSPSYRNGLDQLGPCYPKSLFTAYDFLGYPQVGGFVPFDVSFKHTSLSSLLRTLVAATLPSPRWVGRNSASARSGFEKWAVPFSPSPKLYIPVFFFAFPFCYATPSLFPSLLCFRSIRWLTSRLVPFLFFFSRLSQDTLFRQPRRSTRTPFFVGSYESRVHEPFFYGTVDSLPPSAAVKTLSPFTDDATFCGSPVREHECGASVVADPF